jgi:hypothetical protein
MSLKAFSAHNALQKLTLTTTVLFAVVAGQTRAATVYYLDLINAGPSSVAALEVSRAGGEHFHPLLSGGARLPGAGAAFTVAVRLGEDGCRRDLRVRFADGRAFTYRNFDICHPAESMATDAGQRSVLRADSRRPTTGRPD